MIEDTLLHYLPWLFVAGIALFSVIEWRRFANEKQQQAEIPPREQTTLPDKLILMRSTGRMSPRDARRFALAIPFLLVGMMLLILSPFYATFQEMSLSDILNALVIKISEKPGIIFDVLLFVVITILVPVVTIAVYKNERLILSRNGIEYKPPFTGMLKHWFPGWSIYWEEVAKVSLSNLLLPGQLVIEPRSGKTRRINAAHWHASDHDGPKQRSLLMRLANERRSRVNPERIKQLPLLRYIREGAGLDIKEKQATGLDYDLAQNTHARRVIIILFVIMAYALVDYLANQETYAVMPEIEWFITGGIVAGLITGIWLIKKSVPPYNAWGLGTMLGLIVALALYPGLLRLNQVTDQRGLQQYEYRHTGSGQYSSVREGLPIITMPYDEYWQSIPEDAGIFFSLRRGALPFYQIDMAPQNVKIHKWYCIKYAAGDAVQLLECEK